MATNIELWMLFDDVYRLALSIPITACHRFSARPLAWLRYVAFAIYGAQGYISGSAGGDEVDYSAAIKPINYYYVPRGPPLLLDPQMMDDRTSDASEVTNNLKRDSFRRRVLQRDQSCILVARAPPVQPCYIIPHARGHQYIINLMSQRGEVIEPPLENINDTRNGILLSMSVHFPFRASQVAFLRTPNFAMLMNDVPLVLQPEHHIIHPTVHPSHTQKRLTFQYFNLDNALLEYGAPHNSDARTSDSDDWPPIIFDVAYGHAALTTWGLDDFKEFARQRSKNTYYDGGGGGGGGGGNAGGDGGADGGSASDGEDGSEKLRRSKRIRKQAQNAEAAKHKKPRTVGRLAGNTEDDQPVDAYDTILSLWMRNAERRPRQAHPAKTDSPESKERVQEWLGSVK